MTIELVQQSHLKTQLQNECISDLALSKSHTNSHNSNRNRKIDDENESNDEDYLKLYESNEKVCNEQKNTTKNLLYSTILILIKFFINSYYFIKFSFVHFYYVMYFLYEKLNSKNKQFEMDKIKGYADQFKSMGIQIPKHVCIILNQNVTNEHKIIKKLSAIVDSLSIYGSETITFYQFNSFSTFVREAINLKYNRKDDNNNENDEQNQRSQPIGLRKRNTQNDNKISEFSNKNMNIHFLSNEQGGNSILVSACKNIAARVMNNQIDLKEINQDLIDSQVIELSDMVEPQMVLSIGNEDTLSGFSSWHLRLSEIIKIPSYQLINRITIRDAIIKYNKIEKRFGK